MGSCFNKQPIIRGNENEVRKIPDQPNDQQAFKPFTFSNKTLAVKTQPKPPMIKTGTIADLIVRPVTTRQIQEYDELLKQIKEESQFQDITFKADSLSISKSQNFKASKNAVWKKSSDFLTGEPCLFDNKIEPMDILQGALGDCYFLSSLSALSELPDLVKKLFITQTYQKNGLYGLYLCHDGEFIQVALDDQFPCSIQGGPIFSKCHGNEIWVLLLEKAYAKIYGTYEKIEAGLAGQALRDLTGAPYEYHIRDDKTQLGAEDCWQFISKFNDKKYLLAASSEQSQKGLESQDMQGIISQHCYAILEAKIVVGSDGKQDKIIQMRNPWGRQEWRGDWSDKSSKWTPKLKQECQVIDDDDGIFWIGINDFITEFSQVCTCKIHPNYLYNSIRIKEVPTSELITRRIIIMRVFNKMHAFVSLHQKDKRVYAKEQHNDYGYSLARIIIGKIDSKTNQISTYQGDVMENDREIVVESILEVGDYAIFVEIEWTQNYARDIVVSCYGEFSVSFSETETSELTTTQILDGLLNVHQDFTDKEKIHDYGLNIKRVSGYVAGYVYYLYVNDNDSTTLKEQIEMKKRQFLEICSPFTNSDCFDVEILPKTSQLVKFRVQAKGEGSYNYGTSTQCILIEQLSQEQLQQNALNNPDKIVQRKFQNQGLEVCVHVYSYAAGVALLYCNKTQQTYKEQLELNLTNLKGENCDPSKILQITVPPQAGYLISLKTIDTNKSTSYSMQMTYSLV